MEIHFHLVVTSTNISSEMRKIKSYTARFIVDYPEVNGPKFFLEQLKFYKKSIKMIKSIRFGKKVFIQSSFRMKKC